MPVSRATARARRRTSGDLTATANGNLFKLPAGDASTTITVGGSRSISTAEPHRGGRRQLQLARADQRRSGDQPRLPISRRNRDFSALGNLTLNANAEVDQLSDFGTLTTLGAGANWSPVDRLNLLASWTREEGPPTINQLGDPVLETPGTRIFDFTTGETVLVTAITGGNPDLQADRRKVFKLGGNWQPFAKTDLRLRADYVHQRIDHPISGIYGHPGDRGGFPRPLRRAIRPGRAGQRRPAADQFRQRARDTLRVGFDFSKPLKSRRPSQSVMDQIRAQFGRRDRRRRWPANAAPAPAPQRLRRRAAARRRPASASRGAGRRCRGGGGGGGGRGGRRRARRWRRSSAAAAAAGCNSR